MQPPPRRRRSDDLRLLEVPTQRWISSILRYAPPAEDEDGEPQPPGGVRIPGGTLVTYLPNVLATLIGQFSGERTEPPRELQIKARQRMVFREGHSMKWTSPVTSEQWNLSSVYDQWWLNLKDQLSRIWDDTPHYALLQLNQVRPNSYLRRSTTDARRNQLLADQECEVSQETERQCVGSQIGSASSLLCNRLRITISTAFPRESALRDVAQSPELMQTLSLLPSELLQPSRGLGVSLLPVMGGSHVYIHVFGQDLVRGADSVDGRPAFDATASARSLYTGAAGAAQRLSPVLEGFRRNLASLSANCMFSRREALTLAEQSEHNDDKYQFWETVYILLSDASLEHNTEFTIMKWRLKASLHEERHEASAENIAAAARDCASYFELKDDELFNHRFWNGEFNAARRRDLGHFIDSTQNSNVMRVQVKFSGRAQTDCDDETLLKHPTVRALCLTITPVLALPSEQLSVVVERSGDWQASVNFLMHSPRFVQDCRAAAVARDAEPYSATSEVLAALRRHRLVRPRDLADDMQALQLEDRAA